jgi:hypothetical protein
MINNCEANVFRLYLALKNPNPMKKTRPVFSRLLSPALLLAIATSFLHSDAIADIVYVTSRPEGNPSPGGFNFPLYDEPNGGGSDTSAAGTGVGSPSRSGCRFFSNTFSNRVDGSVGFRVSPTLGVTGGVYRIHHNFNSVVGGNVSSNISLSVTCSLGGTLSFFNAGTNFIQAAGNPANQWKFLGYLTNDVESATPVIDFGYLGGHVAAGASQRLLVDCFRFTLDDPCLDIPVVGVTGPLSSNSNDVVVTGVSASATNVNVYQDSGLGMVLMGSKTSAITAGNNTVTVSGLVKNGIVAATQTINGQEACVPTAGTIVGGGANPRIRVTLSVRETASTGPVGASGSTAGVGANIHFLGASTRISSAPGDGPVLYPSNEWQTITFDRGTIRIANPASASGAIAEGGGYFPNDTVAVRVYAFRTPAETGEQIFSAVPAQATVITSNDFFAVNWTWSAVPDAEGYRLLRNYNSDNYTNFSTDVVATSFLDQNSGWGGLTPVTPILTQTNASVKWNIQTGSSPAGTQNDLQGQWGTIDAIAFAIDDLEDTGPYDLFIDNLQNGATVFQDFEGAPAKSVDYGFRNPSFSGSTSGNILSAPNQAIVSNDAADTGTKSLRVRFQWNSTINNRWLRFTTSGAVSQSPQINLDHPTSLRFLLLPVGATLPPAPAAPTLSVSRVGTATVVNWTGTHRLQAATDVTGPYTTITGVTNAPYTNTFSDSQKFFRLLD